MANNSGKQNYTPYSIYQKRKMAEEQSKGTPLKSIYSKNHNMFSKGVTHLRAGLDSGFATAEGAGKKSNLPAIKPNTKKEEDVKNKTNKATDVNMTGDTNTTNE